MYLGGLVMLMGVLLSLGSWWELGVLVLMMPALIWRLLDEERFLAKTLPGYSEYQTRVRYRLVPFVF